jgi:cobyrinic acid a,c-diamide synthase
MFCHAAATADVAIVEGQFDQAQWCATAGSPNCAAPTGRQGARSTQNRVTCQGGSLDTLSDWLDLPRLAIVDVALLSNCRLPARPAADSLLLDGFADGADFRRWQTILGSLWGIPVVGGLDRCTALRQNFSVFQPGQKPPREWASALAKQFLQYSSLKRILALAGRRGIPGDWSSNFRDDLRPLPRTNAKVAVAYDDAFNCYFPDTLDILELRGATLRVFSPLRDESLPPDTDIVYLGCGAPHEHAEELAANHCMLTALKEHVCSGRRIYAEGGGLAYLCQHVETADGRRTPMVGALRATARRNPDRIPPEPVEITLAIDTWLGSAGTSLRGYRNSNWLLEPTGCLTRFAKEAAAEFDLIGRHQAIGSRIHLNFAAQPNLLAGFLRPCPAALAWAAAR